MARLLLRRNPILLLAGAVSLAGCAGGSPVSPSKVPSVAAGATAAQSARPMDDKDDGTDPTPAPVPILINIVGSFGIIAYDPNPATAALGNTLVWTNNDKVTHHIVLDDPNFDLIDDSIDVGILAPGESSLPVELTRETAQFHCTIHPSMKGGINELPIQDIEPPPYDPYRVRVTP